MNLKKFERYNLTASIHTFSVKSGQEPAKIKQVDYKNQSK